MKRQEQTSFADSSRANARACAKDGLAALARAFNHCGSDDLAYSYADEVQSRFLELATELVGLVESGAIEQNPTHAQHLRLQVARSDRAVQLVIQKARRSAGGRARRVPGH